MRPRLLLLCLLPVLAACADSGGGDVIAVQSSDTACEATETELAAGKLTFEVENIGDEATELYVYGKGDRIISEVENVGPGAKRKLTVNLKAGEYELACKPGQRGKGIRVPIVVSGEGGEQSAGGRDEQLAMMGTFEVA